ncbi:MAG: glycerophosphodiester phosphodiesterase [Vagococcus sp.]|uniref:glycerophosphodiester phosphodiesterase n=1 Tax=Vagococcus sp. TaxID=1933889 RepID=UPI002FCBDE5E
MPMFQLFKKITKEFFSHCFSYLMLFFSMNIMLFIAVTVFDFLASTILKFQNIPYLSYTNLLVLVQKPVATILLLLLFMMLIVMVFFQFSYSLLGIRQIYQRRFNLAHLIKESWLSVKGQRLSSYVFFLFYFILILPVAQEVFNTQLLNKVVIPAFIMDFLANNLWYALIVAFLGLLIGYIAIRWIFILPLMVLGDMSSKEAMRKSLAITKKRFWHFSWRIFIFTMLSMGIKYIIFVLIYMFQVWLDTKVNPYPLIGGVINLSLVQIIDALGGAWTSVLLMYLLLREPEILPLTKREVIFKPSTRWLNRINGIVVIVTCITILVFNVFFLNGLIQRTPKTVSHRGVDSLEHPNGVQNTIPALKKTMKLKPDYVEMDIQETKDGEFVMMHDPNLAALTGVNEVPQKMTLKEITALTARENGMEAEIPSFDDYLEAANQGGQKLLIEIKTSKFDSPDLMVNFIEKYEKIIIANHHSVQSLDYNVVDTLKEKAPKIPVSYILPYNFVFPNTEANAYTMEATTLNDSFVTKAHTSKRQVFAWTVNETDVMSKVMFMDVDGIITDELSVLNDEIENFQKSPSYADRIMYYISVIPSSNEISH